MVWWWWIWSYLGLLCTCLVVLTPKTLCLIYLPCMIHIELAFTSLYMLFINMCTYKITICCDTQLITNPSVFRMKTEAAVREIVFHHCLSFVSPPSFRSVRWGEGRWSKRARRGLAAGLSCGWRPSRRTSTACCCCQSTLWHRPPTWHASWAQGHSDAQNGTDFELPGESSAMGCCRTQTGPWIHGGRGRASRGERGTWPWKLFAMSINLGVRRGRLSGGQSILCLMRIWAFKPKPTGYRWKNCPNWSMQHTYQLSNSL